MRLTKQGGNSRTITDMTFIYSSTGREGRVRVTTPVGLADVGDGTHPMLWFHGFGASHHAYGPIAERMALNGYVFIQPEFPDSSIFETPVDTIEAKKYWDNRIEEVLDLAHAIAADELFGMVTSKQLILGGHSMGAQTALFSFGTNYIEPFGGAEVQHIAPGAVGCVAMSPQGVDTMTDLDSWSELAGPLMVLTGTKDPGSERTGNPWSWRIEPWRHYGAMRNVESRRYLSVLHEGDHGFGSVTESPDRPPNAAHKELTLGQIHAFCDAFASQDIDARALIDDEAAFLADPSIAFYYARD